MSGTKIGGKKAAYKNKLLHGLDFYARIGAKGGRNGHTGGFAANPELAREAGRKGGRKSRRTGVKNGQGKTYISEIRKGLDSSNYKEYLPKEKYDDERVNYQSY